MTIKQLPKFNISLLYPRHWPIWAGVAVLWLIVQLPYPVIYRLGCALGSLVQLIMRRRVYIAHCNLKMCFPKMSEHERQLMLVKNFESVGMGLMEVGIAWFWSDKRISHWYKVTGTGMGPINQLQEKKTGVLLVGIHFLTLEIGARMFGLQTPGIGVYRPNNNPVIDWLQIRGRMRSNKRMINRKNLKEIIRALKNGEVVWYAPDHDYGYQASVFVPLFAVEKAATTTGTWILARMSNAAIVPFVPRRKPNGKGYELIMLEPQLTPPLNNAEITAHWMNGIIERCIMLAPEQYMWLHRRFKTRPVGAPLYY